MIYFKIKKSADQRSRKDGSFFIESELYTQKEAEKYNIPAAYYDIVNMSKKSVYWFFGARFAK